MRQNRLFLSAALLSIFATGHFPARVQAQQSPQGLDSKCTRLFPSIAMPNYVLEKIEFGIFAPPEGGIVRFLVTNSSKLRASAAELLAPVSMDKEKKILLWWTAEPIDFTRLLNAQPMDTFDPKDPVPFNASQTIGITPGLFIGNRAYCLTNQMNYTWSDQNPDSKKTTDQINEEWYGTTAQSPVYAAVRIRWSLKPAP
jgi:hypothetical protein